MKILMISISITMIWFTGYGQSVDPAALQILQKSYDQFAAMKSISYKMTMIDTMMRENKLIVERQLIRGRIEKNEYSHFRINDKLEWLVRGDTLFKREKLDTGRVTFTTSWDKHKIGAISIYNVLGTERPAIDKYTASLQFANDTADGEFYVIDKIYKTTDHGIDEIKTKLKFNRYFIKKKSLLAFRSIKYGKSLVRDEEIVDIYDFYVSLDTSVNTFNSSAFFAASPVKENDRFGTLKTGNIAPSFKATDLRTGKPVSLEELKGKVVILDFWYLSCMPCRVLMPKLQKLQEKFENEKVVIIGINVRDEDPKAIIKFLKDKHILYRQYYQIDQLLVSNYKLQAFPTTLVLGMDGKIKMVETGIGEDTELKLEQTIRKELNDMVP